MNNMNRCIGTQSKMIYGCHQNFRILDPQSQVVANQVHQAPNPHQLPTQQITKINTTSKSDQQQLNKDASDNQNISYSQGDQQPVCQPQQPGANQPFGAKASKVSVSLKTRSPFIYKVEMFRNVSNLSFFAFSRLLAYRSQQNAWRQPV